MKIRRHGVTGADSGAAFERAVALCKAIPSERWLLIAQGDWLPDIPLAWLGDYHALITFDDYRHTSDYLYNRSFDFRFIRMHDLEVLMKCDRFLCSWALNDEQDEQFYPKLRELTND